MKRFFAPVSALLLMASGFIVWRSVRPFAPEPLRTPTSEQLFKAFPKNTRTIFENSEQFYFYSLDPSWLSQRKNKFHDWGILGRTPISDKATQLQIRALYFDGIADTNFSAACFNPRHGIRAVKGKDIFDLVICFRCGHSMMYLNGEKLGHHHFGSRLQTQFDAILTDHDVPLAPK